MKKLREVARIVLIVLTAFLALTAIAGGAALAAGINAPPPEQLRGSLFTSFLIPGLALLVLVGGSALAAAILLLRRHPLSGLLATIITVFSLGTWFIDVRVSE